MMQPPPLTSYDADSEHIRLLVIFHYVLAGLYGLGLLFVIAHGFFMMAVFPTILESQGEAPPGEFLAWLPLVYGLGATLVIAMGLLNFLSARAMKQRTRRMLSLVVAGLNCFNIPIGLVLGVFTFIVLLRPSVAVSYGRPA
jgi:phage shock protein PspC (stress-responsive transcriptional regulator)